MNSEFAGAKKRQVTTVIGAPSSIGIRPYDHGSEPREIARAPHILRELGLINRLGANDFGDVIPPPYQDLIRPPGKPRNEAAVVQYSRALADRVADCVAPSQFTVVLGGDCGIVLGCLLGASRQVGRVGLVYIDAHADFATPEQSETGSVAGMCLALAVGHGDSPLARLAGPTPLVRAQDVVLVGRRDGYEPSYGHAALAISGILDLPGLGLPPIDGTPGISKIFDRVGHGEVGGFWIHVDADVLDALIMPSTAGPEPGGPGIEELAVLLRQLVSHPQAVGYALAFFVAPGPLIAYYGIASSVEGIFMSRFFGMGLLGIGLITWLTRNVAETEAGRSIVLALVITYGVGVILALTDTLFGPFNALGWIAIGLNLLLGLGFGYFQFIKPIQATT